MSKEKSSDIVGAGKVFTDSAVYQFTIWDDGRFRMAIIIDGQYVPLTQWEIDTYKNRPYKEWMKNAARAIAGKDPI